MVRSELDRRHDLSNVSKMQGTSELLHSEPHGTEARAQARGSLRPLFPSITSVLQESLLWPVHTCIFYYHTNY